MTVYIARFTAEAWQNDNAVPVGPKGETTWDCTERVRADTDYWARMNAGGDWDDVLDKDDVLKDDPAAPEWVRQWQGPFTITITRKEPAFVMGEPGGGKKEPSPVTSPLPAASHWDDHPDFPPSDWQYEVSNGDTRQSYAEWVHAKRADKAEEQPPYETDPEWGDCGKCGQGNVMRPDDSMEPEGTSECTACEYKDSQAKEDLEGDDEDDDPAIKVTVTRSAGKDGAVVVFIETEFEPNSTDDSPGLRVAVNDRTIMNESGDGAVDGVDYEEDPEREHEYPDHVFEVKLSELRELGQ